MQQNSVNVHGLSRNQCTPTASPSCLSLSNCPLPVQHKNFFSQQYALVCRDSADRVVQGKGKFEELMACAHEIAASTTQLVIASKVKADRTSANMKELSKASKEVNTCTATVVASAKSGAQIVEDAGGWSGCSSGASVLVGLTFGHRTGPLGEFLVAYLAKVISCCRSSASWACRCMRCYSVYLSKMTAAARAELPRPTSVYGVSVLMWVRLQQLQKQRCPILLVCVVL